MTETVVVVVNHQHRGRWLASGPVPSPQTSCDSGVVTLGEVVGDNV